MRTGRRARPSSRPRSTATSTRTVRSRQRVRLPTKDEEAAVAGARPGRRASRGRWRRCGMSATHEAPPSASRPLHGDGGGAWPRWSRTTPRTRASGGSAPSSGPTRPSWTSASAATRRANSTALAGRDGSDIRRHRARVGDRGARFVDAVAAVMDRRMADRRAHRRAGRGRAPAQRRHERRDEGARQKYGPRSRARHAHQRERLLRAGRRDRARRPVPPRRRVHVRGLHVGRRRPGLQPDRQGAAHVRRRQRRAARAAHARSRWARATGRSTSMDPAGIFATEPGLAHRRARRRRPTTSG